METWYKPAKWNGQENDAGPGAIPMKTRPKCTHSAYYTVQVKGKYDLEESLDPHFKFCKLRCGYAVKY